MITVEIRSGASIAIHAPGQSGEFIFPPNTRRTQKSPLGILMTDPAGHLVPPALADPPHRVGQVQAG